MTNKSLNAVRMVLLVAIVLLFAITAFLYFRTGKFDFTTFFGAGMITVIFLVTRPKDRLNERTKSR